MSERQILDKFHDVNNCLNGIMGYAQMTALSCGDDKHKMEIIIEQCNEIVKLLADVKKLIGIK